MKYVATLLLLLLATAPAPAAGKPISYNIEGKPFEGYFIAPAPKAPFILLIHDWDGLTEYEVKRAKMLADLGYAVFAVDLFGAGVRPTELTDKRRITDGLYADRETMRKRLYAGLKTAESLGADTKNAVAMGYCFGGAAVLELARSGANLKGFVTFHGGLVTPAGEDYSKAQGKFLILHGTADTNVTIDDFANLAKALEANGINHEMTTYSGAPHAFTVFGANSYREDADKKSWRRFTEFLGETLGR